MDEKLKEELLNDLSPELRGTNAENLYLSMFSDGYIENGCPAWITWAISSEAEIVKNKREWKDEQQAWQKKTIEAAIKRMKEEE